MVDGRAVPVAQFAAREALVGGDAGEPGGAEVPVQRQGQVGGAVVSRGLGIGADAGELREVALQAPAGGAAVRVRGLAGVAARRRHVQALRIGAVLVVAEADARQQVGRDVHLQLPAHGIDALVAQLLAGHAVVLPGAAALAGDGQPAAHAVGQRPGQVALRLHGRVRARADAEAGLGLARGPARQQVDGAGRRVLAVQRALRPAQHLHAFQVEQQALRLHREGEAHLVHVHAHGRGIVGAVVLEADAADAELRLAAAERGFDLQAGHLALQLVDLADAAGLEFVAGQHADRDADVLGRFSAALGRHLDAVQRGDLGGVDRCEECSDEGGGQRVEASRHVPECASGKRCTLGSAAGRGHEALGASICAKSCRAESATLLGSAGDSARRRWKKASMALGGDACVRCA